MPADLPPRQVLQDSAGAADQEDMYGNHAWEGGYPPRLRRRRRVPIGEYRENHKNMKLGKQQFFYNIWHLGGSRMVQNTPTGCGNNLPTCVEMSIIVKMLICVFPEL